MSTRGRSKPRRRKSRRFAVLCVLVLLLYVGWLFMAIPARAYPGTVTFRPADATNGTASVDWPAYGQAAVGTQNYGVLATNGSQTAVPIASVAKVMLALSVLRTKPFTDGRQGATLTITQNDVAIYNHYFSVGGSITPVQVGEKISEYQALQALLLPSANNFADTLAIWAFGSVENYTVYANNYAAVNSLNATHFADASGFDPASVSSASDLVRLGQQALDNPVIADIVAQPTATIPVAGNIRNVNSLVNNGFIGIKTGNTDQAGGCLLFAARHEVNGQSVTIVGAVLGAPTLSRALHDSYTLLASAQTNFVSTTVIRAGQIVGHYTLPTGVAVAAKADTTLTTVAWKGSPIRTQVALNGLRLPAKSNRVVGKVIATGSPVNDRVDTSVSLSQSATPPSFNWRLLHPLQTWHLRTS